MSAPPSGFAPRPASFRRYRTLALAATLLPCAALSLHATPRHKPATVHAPAHKQASAPQHGKAASKRDKVQIARADEARPKHKAGKQIATDEPVTKAKLYRNPAPLLYDAPVKTASAKRSAPKPTTARAVAEDVPADRTAQERVHAWMQSRNAAAATETEQLTDQESAPSPAKAPKPVVAKAVKAAPEPDLSPAPRKATIDDFDRAAQRQTQTVPRHRRTEPDTHHRR